MPPNDFAFAATPLSAPLSPIDPLTRLWCLRILVRLDAQKAFIRRSGFESENIAGALELTADGDATESADEDLDFDSGPEVDPRAARAALRRQWQRAERSVGKTLLPANLSRNLERLAAVLGLSEADRRILGFAVLLASDPILRETAELLGNLSISTRVYRALSLLLDLPQQAVKASLCPSAPLVRSGLIDRRTGHSGDLTEQLIVDDEAFVHRIVEDDCEPIELLRDRIVVAAPPTLSIDDFPHIERSTSLAVPWLRHALEAGRPGVNLFVYGPPGTGKSELSRLLAQQLDCPLFEGAAEKGTGSPLNADARLKSLHVAQALLARQRAMIVFDEAEEIFDGGGSIFSQSIAQSHKAWINQTLETNPAPVIWIANATTALDAAFLRRFDLVIELPVPPQPQRERILATLCGDLLAPTEVSRFADSEHLAPAIVARAATVLRGIDPQSAPALAKHTPAEHIEHLVSSTLRAQGHRAIRRIDPNRLPDHYDPALLNTDTDLTRLAEGIAHAGSARLCLYGPPGTGKTAYARWLARKLDQRLIVKRASELLSKWVGGTERRIAEAFREADAEGAVLLIDEIDGLLQDRRDAKRSWEITQVNELLTCMESFAGVFIASTNLVPTLDQAALRRFDLKVRFDFLLSAQAWALLQSSLQVIGIEPADEALRARADKLHELTPGDYATVVRQHRFRPLATAADFIAALEDELAVRHPLTASIGFVRAA